MFLGLISCTTNQEPIRRPANLPLPYEYRKQLGIPEQQQPINERLLKRVDEAKDKYIIKTGFFAGECMNYCKSEYQITSEGIKTTKEAWNLRDDLPKLPSLIYLSPVDSLEYAKLIRIVESVDIKSGKSTFGCPDCRDQGGEWFEISRDTVTFRITCEPGQDIVGYSSVLESIRNVRGRNKHSS